MTALSLVSKGDLAFLCEPAGGGAASVIVDASEQRTNLTNNTTYCSEANSARTAIDAPRTICVVVDMTTTSQRFIVHHGSSTTTYGYTIDKSGSAVRCRENATTRVSVTVPGLTGSARKVLVHWAQRNYNGSVVSEVAVYNFVTLEWAYGTASHAAFATTPTHTLTIGSSTGGLSAYDLGITAIHAVSIGRRFHSTTESSIDYVAVPTPPAMPGRRRVANLTGPSSELPAEEGYFAGPSYLWALAATRDADSRLITPLVNLMIANPYSEVVTPTARYHRNAPGSTVFRLSTRWLWHAWPGPKVNAARCRIHVAVTGFAGVCPVMFRMYSIANLPVGQPKPPPLLAYTTTTQTINASTGAAGVWLDLGQVRLARDDAGMTALALALNFNDNLGDAYATSVKIRAVTVEPLSADLSGGGFGDVDGDDKKGA